MSKSECDFESRPDLCLFPTLLRIDRMTQSHPINRIISLKSKVKSLKSGNYRQFNNSTIQQFNNLTSGDRGLWTVVNSTIQ